MSKIPYFFETPVPTFFKENGWFKSENSWKFISWAFSKCSREKRTIVLDGKQITLEPFEFVTGRYKSSIECFMTESSFRNQLNAMSKAGFLKKTTNSTTNRFTCYVWIIQSLTNNNNPATTDSTTNKRPTHSRLYDHKSDNKNDRYKENHHPYPSSSGLTDDFSFDQEKGSGQDTVEVEGAKMSKKELEECISIKGTLDEVHRAVRYILNHPGKKSTIKSWPNAMKTWSIPKFVQSVVKENESKAEEMVKNFSRREGWSCEIYNDRQKDQRGLLFFNNQPTGNSEPVFIAFHDKEFESKAFKVLRDKRMQKGLIASA